MSDLHILGNSTNISVLLKRLMVVFFITGLVGCTTDAPMTPASVAIDIDSHTPKIKKIALVTSLAPPEIESVDLGVTQGEGAVVGAAGGALLGTSLNLSIATSATGGAAIILLWPVFVLGGAIAGTASGVAAGYSADTLAEAEENSRYMLNAAYLQTELLDQTQNYSLENTDLEFIRVPDADPYKLVDKPDYKTLSDESIDAVLEVELSRFSLEHSLEADARARLISTRTGAVLSDAYYKFLSERHTLEEWVANDAAQLTKAVQQALRKLAEDIVDENFLLFYPNESKKVTSQQADKIKDQAQEPQDKHVPYYVLSPVYPTLSSEFCIFCITAMGFLEFVMVDSVQPTLRWESFPRDWDLVDDDKQRQRIAGVRYDLRIFNATTTPPSSGQNILIPSQLVYDVRNTTESYHKVESKLDACSNYFWTVRARFKLDGRSRITEWAGAFDVIGWNEKPWNLRRGLHTYQQWSPYGTPLAFGPEWFYYPFSTPCNSEKNIEPSIPEHDDEEF